ncbi:DNA repair protein SWI5 homolog [Erethizon dorsatum]
MGEITCCSRPFRGRGLPWRWPWYGLPLLSVTSGCLAGGEPALRPPALDPPALQSPPTRGPRTPGLRSTEPGLSRSCRGAFRSPRPSPKSGQADGTSEEALHLDVQKLKEKRDTLDKEISQLISEGYRVDELEAHISQLHEYNDVKDVGQMLLGKLAVIRGVTTKELYPEFDLDVND